MPQGCNRLVSPIAALLLTAAAASPAQATSVQATVDRNTATIQDRIVLTVTVDGNPRGRPVLPPLASFDVKSAGTSRQIDMTRGATTISFDYVLFPKAVGTFTIGAIRVQVDGRAYETKPFNLRIVAAGAQTGEGSLLFVRAKVSNDQPYVGEQVVYTLRFYRRVRFTNANLEWPDFDGFLAEDLGKEKSYETVLRGQKFAVSELRRALFPQEVAKLTINPAALKVDVVLQRKRRSRFGFDPFGDFFGAAETEERVLRPKPIAVEVRPRPAAPAGFSGLVGRFNVKAQLSKTKLKVGESTTLTVTVSGKGNVRSIGEPAIAGLAGFKVYDDKPTSSVDNSGQAIRGSKSFRKSLVPIQPGDPILPPIALVYFDPEAGSYQTSRSRSFPLHIAPADGKEELKLTELIVPEGGAVGVKVGLEVLGDDILPIYKGLDALAAHTLSSRAGVTWGGAFLFPPLIFLGLALARRRAEREALDAAIRRRRTALGRARRALKPVAALLAKGDGAAAATCGSRVLREFLGDEMGIEGLAFTPGDAASQLAARSVPEALVTTVSDLLTRCDAAQYGGGADASELSNLPAELKALMKKLDQRLKR